MNGDNGVRAGTGGEVWGPDVALLADDLMWAFLDQGDPAAASAVVDLLTGVYETVPDGPDATLCAYRAVLALAVLVPDGQATWAEVAQWARRAALGAAHDLVDLDDVLIMAAGARFLEFVAAHEAAFDDPTGPEAGGRAARALTDRFLADLLPLAAVASARGLGPRAPGPATVAFYQCAGVLHHELGMVRHLEHGVPFDTVRAQVLEVATTLPDVPDDAAGLFEFLGEYAHACGFVDELALGLEAVARARRLHADAVSDGAPVDEEYLHDLGLVEAEFHEMRYYRTGDPADRDAALATLAPLVDHGDAVDAESLATYAELLAYRGDDNGTAADLIEASGHLREALRRGVDETADRLHLLAVIHHRLTDLTDGASRRDHQSSAAAWAQAALDEGLDDPAQVALACQVVAEEAERRARAADWDEPETLAEAIAAFRAAGAVVHRPELDLSTRAELALAMATLECGLVDKEGHAFTLAGFERLIAYAAAHPDPPQGWNLQLGLLRANAGMYRDAFDPDGPRPTSPFGLDPIRDALGAVSHEEVRPLVGSLAGFQIYLAAMQSGDLAQLAEARALLSASPEPALRAMAGLAEVTLLSASGAPLTEQLAAVERFAALARAGLPADLAGPMLAAVEPLLRQSPLGASLVAPHRPAEDRPSGAAGLRTPVDFAAALAEIAALAAALSGGGPLDLAAVRSRLTAVEQLAGAARVGVYRRGLFDPLTFCWLLFARASGDLAGAGRAIECAREALAAFPADDSPRLAQLALNLAEAHRLRDLPGDRAEARAMGLRALRGHAWQVLLQSGTRFALAAAKQASARALRVAAWCADDHRAGEPGALEDLLTALESGRGLVLHAAVTARSASERLRAAGRGDLAEAWERDQQQAVAAENLGIVEAAFEATDHGRLRREVLETLGGPGSGGELLAPPALAEIRAALSAHGTDALVYLVPGDGATDAESSAPSSGPGRIVVVPADASWPVEVVEMPGLVIGGSPVEAYAEAYAAWRAAGGDAAPGDQGLAALDAAFMAWRGALATLTDWAGQAAAALLGRVRRFAADPARPRITITAFGALGLVPWHAARLPGDGARLARHAVVSYIPSARLLIRTGPAAGRDPNPAHGEVLLVGNPAGTAPTAAGADAWELRRAFYGGGGTTFLGVAPEGARPGAAAGPGTPEEVLAWFARPGRGERRTAHLACHGLANPADPTASHLRLGGDRPLSVADLLAAAPAASLDLELVLLAACSTHVTGTGYDEAFSLATAFLAAGARTVYGSLWDLPDRYTSKLMFVLHDALVGEGDLAPADALHWAQEWALDPDRVPPDAMPTAMLPTLGGTLPFDDPAAWAGLIHLGA